MIKAVLLFVVGLICLIKGGDWFVEGASSLARIFKLPEILIGATVVSIGTTLPEVMVSTMSALEGHGEIAYGNAIGSVICNTALIAAITLALRPGPVDKKPLKLPVAFFYLAAAVYCVSAYVIGSFVRPIGIILLLLFVTYICLNVRSVKGLVGGGSAAAAQAQSSSAPADGAQSSSDGSGELPMSRIILYLIAGAVLIAIGANLLVDNGTLIAQALGVPESVIALTFVALGTSLPELVTAVTSLIKGHGSLSLGNVIGANFFDLALVSGVSVTLAPFKVPQSAVLFGRNASLVFEIPTMLVVMTILTVPPLLTGKLKRWQGILLLAIYAVFCAVQFTM